MRGSLIPRSEKARWTKPEQSSPLAGSVPPNTYGTPRYFFALATTASPPVDPVPFWTAASWLANAVPSVAAMACAERMPSWVWICDTRDAMSVKLMPDPRYAAVRHEAPRRCAHGSLADARSRTHLAHRGALRVGRGQLVQGALVGHQ